MSIDKSLPMRMSCRDAFNVSIALNFPMDNSGFTHPQFFSHIRQRNGTPNHARCNVSWSESWEHTSHKSQIAPTTIWVLHSKINPHCGSDTFRLLQNYTLNPFCACLTSIKISRSWRIENKNVELWQGKHDNNTRSYPDTTKNNPKILAQYFLLAHTFFIGTTGFLELASKVLIWMKIWLK